MEYNITYRQKDKGWQYIISRKENGKWRQVKSKQGFKTKKDAKPMAEEMLKSLKKEDLNKKDIVNIDYNSITLANLFDAFIEHNKLYREPKTILTYRNSKSAFKELLDTKVVDIKKIHVQKVIDSLTSNELKRSTIELHLSKFKLALEYYRDNYDNNYVLPVKNLTLPKKVTEEKISLTKTELDHLLNNVKEHENILYYITALIAGYCGLRISEILGLTWDDISEEEMTLNINKQWKTDKKGNENFGTLKSKNSYRKVPLPIKVLNELKQYRKNGITDINKKIIATNIKSFNVRINEILNKYTNVSIHELRHTYATLLISNDIDFKTAAKFLGHDVKETIATYSHVNDDMIKNASSKIKKIF